MRMKVAAAAPEIVPGQPGQSMAHIFSCISRARDDGAALLVLPAGMPELNQGAVLRQAGSMTVYPLTAGALTKEQLADPPEGLDVLCCASDAPATASSLYENEELAASASLARRAVAVLACPRGGDGGKVYTGQCVIAQNGFVLASNEDGYAIARVTVPRRDVKTPAEETVDSQPLTPWTPLPAMLPRVLHLQADALARRVQTGGTAHLALTVREDIPSLLALLACVEAVDRLRISRRNIHVQTFGADAARVAAALGVADDGGHDGLLVDTADLTARCLEGAVPAHYAVNTCVPRGVGGMVVRTWANTCGVRELAIPLRTIACAEVKPWEMYDFLLYFSLVHGLPRWPLARLLEDTFHDRYAAPVIGGVLDEFFDRYHHPAPCDGPSLFSHVSRYG